MLAISLFFGIRWWSMRPISHPPGIIAPTPPIQKNISSPKPFRHLDYTITPLADFEVSARVLSREDYYIDASAELSPTDLALGWGRMSDEAVISQLEIEQSVRFYTWRTRRFPIPREEISASSANMHIIPADENVKDQLKNVRVGHIVDFEGYLVKIHRQHDGFRWQSSLTRTDTGAGACEVIWVKSLRYR